MVAKGLAKREASGFQQPVSSGFLTEICNETKDESYAEQR